MNRINTGKFITIEGIDGAGKTAIMATVISTIKSAGIKIIETREPGGTLIGEKLRELVLDPENHFSVEAEILAIFAARAQHLDELILPAIRKGDWVLCDRFTDSTHAYQGGGRKYGRERICIIENWLQDKFRPDLTLFLNADTDVGQSRVRNNNQPLDRFELENHEFHERVRKTFCQIAAEEPDRVKIIDANRTESEVCELTRQLINEFLQK